MTTFDPATTASQLATSYTAGLQGLLTTQNKAATATSSALTKLQSALSAFNTALTTLSTKKTLSQFSATPSTTGVLTATASAGAVPGSYPLFVEKVATSHQIAFTDLPALSPGVAGKITLNQGGSPLVEVTLSDADFDGDGSLSYAEIARAINSASGNAGKVTASVMTVGGKSQLLLKSGVSGEAGALSLSANGDVASDLAAALNAPPTEVVRAQDALVWLGAQGTGVRIQQSSNTLTAIEGVSVTLTAAQAAGANPIVLQVAKDESATAANVQSFVDSYNPLTKVIDGLTTTGKDGAASPAFATDSGVRSLRPRLNSMLRQDFGGLALRDLGVSADRTGTLSLDKTKLTKTLTTSPDAMDTVFGKSSLTVSSGVLGGFNKIVAQWTNVPNGQLKQRQPSVDAIQKAIPVRQTRLDAQYDTLYDRYLKQFSILQTLESSMGNTTSMLSALSSTKSS